MIAFIRADGCWGEVAPDEPELAHRRGWTRRDGWGGNSLRGSVRGWLRGSTNQRREKPSRWPNPFLGNRHPATPPGVLPSPSVIELSLSFDFEETHQSVVSGSLKRAEKLLSIRGYNRNNLISLIRLRVISRYRGGGCRPRPLALVRATRRITWRCHDRGLYTVATINRRSDGRSDPPVGPEGTPRSGPGGARARALHVLGFASSSIISDSA